MSSSLAMRIRRKKIIFYALMFFLAGCSNSSKDVLTYTLQLKPGMTIAQVKALFPKEMHWKDDQADEIKQNCWMIRRYSSNSVSRRVVFLEPGHGWRATTVYFDSKGKLVGLHFDASSGSQLEDDDLRFPGELRFPTEVMAPHSKSAPAAKYLTVMPSPVTK